MRRYELLVIGAGSAGVRAARLAAGQGVKVAIAEAGRFGGTCVVRGCVPKKLTVLATRIGQTLQAAPLQGWNVGPSVFDWPSFKRRRDSEIVRLESIYVQMLERAGVELLRHRAAFVDPHQLDLSNGARISAERVLVASGGYPAVLDGLPGGHHLATSDDLFRWEHRPQDVVILGAGYIATEYASLLSQLGSNVTIVHRDQAILGGFDTELSAIAREQLVASGVRIVDGESLASVERHSRGFTAFTAGGLALEADVVLGATGRVPATASLGLERAGVICDAAGAIVVDQCGRTNVPHIHAAGDVTNRLNLTPVAIRDAQSFFKTVYEGLPTEADHALVPTCVFMTPEIASVGLREQDAAQAGDDIDVYATSFRPLSAALSGAREQVFMKMLVRRFDGRVLGCHMVGPEAAEAIQLLAVAMRAGATKSDFDSTTSLHPTMAEEWLSLKAPVRRLGEHAGDYHPQLTCPNPQPGSDDA